MRAKALWTCSFSVLALACSSASQDAPLESESDAGSTAPGPSDVGSSRPDSAAPDSATSDAAPSEDAAPVPNGPYAWGTVTILGGGFVPGIVMSLAEPGLMYARTDIGGAYRWNSTSSRWVALNDALPASESNLMGIESIAADPLDPERVYLAAGMYSASWGSPGAFLRSSDRGKTWQRTEPGIKMGANDDGRSSGERLVIDPSDTSVLYFGSRRDGLLRSVDRAVTFENVPSFSYAATEDGIGITFVVIDPTTGGSGKRSSTLYVGLANPDASLYRSTDAAATFQPVAGGPPGLVPNHGALASDGLLYLSYGDTTGPNGMTKGAVHRFDPSNGTWTDISPTPSATSRGGYGAVAVDAHDPATVMAVTMDRWGSDDIFRSTSRGASWAPLFAASVLDVSGAQYLYYHKTQLGRPGWLGDIEIDPFDRNRAIYPGWVSDDVTNADRGQKTHWTYRSVGLEETAIKDLISPPDGAHLLSAMDDLGGFRHDDFAVSPPDGMFDNPRLSTGTSLDFAELAPLTIVRVGFHDNGAPHGAVSLDGGKTWAPFATEPTGVNAGGSVAITADASAIVWAPTGLAPVVSTDRGGTWTPVVGLPMSARVLADRASPSKVYGWAPLLGALYASTDAGAHFEPAASGLPMLDEWTGYEGRFQAVFGRQGDLWLALAAGGLYHSTDGARTFQPIEAVISAVAVGFGRAAPGKSYPSVYVTGQMDVEGIFRSDDAGAAWIRINDDEHQFGTPGVITGDPRIYGRVYLGTGGRGIMVGPAQ